MTPIAKKLLRWGWPLLLGFVLGVFSWVSGCHNFRDNPPAALNYESFQDSPAPASGPKLVSSAPEPVRVIQMKSCLDTRQDLVTADWQPPSEEFERFCGCFADGLNAEIGEPRLRTLDLTRGPMTESEEGIVMGIIDGCLIEFKVPPPW